MSTNIQKIMPSNYFDMKRANNTKKMAIKHQYPYNTKFQAESYLPWMDDLFDYLNCKSRNQLNYEIEKIKKTHNFLKH